MSTLRMTTHKTKPATRATQHHVLAFREYSRASAISPAASRDSVRLAKTSAATPAGHAGQQQVRIAAAQPR